MKTSEWAEMHCELGENDDDYTGTDTVEVDIDWGSYVTYVCEVNVQTYRNLPSSGDVVKMTRTIFDDNGEITDFIEVEPLDFPHFIAKAAVKKAVEMS